MRDHFRAALEEGDVALLCKMWAHLNPHLPQPASIEEGVMCLHLTRTASGTVSFAKRAYSHRWLAERGLPSQLPDHLKPKAERMYPRIVEAVGIAVDTARPDLKRELETAMSNAVLECYANGNTDPEFIKARMMDARKKVMRL